MAAALYNQLIRTNDAESAGTEVIVGKPIHEEVLQVLKDHGLVATGLFRKQLTKQMFDNASQVFLMTDKSIPDYMKNNSKVTYWNIPDPRDKGLEVHQEVFRMIEEKVKEVLVKS
jgi:protein-tyrosine-phosphatase